MNDETQLDLKDPWLVAAWPGMGSVALGAAGALVRQYDGEPVGLVPAQDYFDVDQIDVSEGLIEPGRLPRSTFFACRIPDAPHDLLVLVAEAQPAQRGYAYAHHLLAWAESQGVSRVFTFAAMASQMHPTDTPEVYGVATRQALLEELRRLEVTLLQDGQISGLNGVLLAAAAERGIEGTGLLGQIPFYAAGVPSPRASLATLDVFSSMAQIEVDPARLQEQATEIEQTLLQALEQLKQHQEGGGGFSFDLTGSGEEGEPLAPEGEEEAEGEADAAGRAEPELGADDRERIERLFEQTRKDRSKAVELKRELDRLGVFRKYEDRFLDLFKRAE